MAEMKYTVGALAQSCPPDTFSIYKYSAVTNSLVRVSCKNTAANFFYDCSEQPLILCREQMLPKPTCLETKGRDSAIKLHVWACLHQNHQLADASQWQEWLAFHV